MAAKAVFPDEPADSIMSVMTQAFDPAFGEAWNRRQVADALVLGTCRHALIGADGAIGESVASRCIGFFLSRNTLDEEELLLFAVLPEERGKGFGKKLLDHFVSSARERGLSRLFLEMRHGNPAGHLYERQGFRSVGIRPSYYKGKDGIRRDAVSYAMDLIQI